MNLFSPILREMGPIVEYWINSSDVTSELQLEMEKFIKITMAVDTASRLALDEIMTVMIEEIDEKPTRSQVYADLSRVRLQEDIRTQGPFSDWKLQAPLDQRRREDGSYIGPSMCWHSLWGDNPIKTGED